eukprot:g7743.t1
MSDLTPVAIPDEEVEDVINKVNDKNATGSPNKPDQEPKGEEDEAEGAATPIQILRQFKDRLDQACRVDGRSIDRKVYSDKIQDLARLLDQGIFDGEGRENCEDVEEWLKTVVKGEKELRDAKKEEKLPDPCLKTLQPLMHSVDATVRRAMQRDKDLDKARADGTLAKAENAVAKGQGKGQKGWEKQQDSWGKDSWGTSSAKGSGKGDVDNSKKNSWKEAGWKESGYKHWWAKTVAETLAPYVATFIMWTIKFTPDQDERVVKMVQNWLAMNWFLFEAKKIISVVSTKVATNVKEIGDKQGSLKMTSTVLESEELEAKKKEKEKEKAAQKEKEKEKKELAKKETAKKAAEREKKERAKWKAAGLSSKEIEKILEDRRKAARSGSAASSAASRSSRSRSRDRGEKEQVQEASKKEIKPNIFTPSTAADGRAEAPGQRLVLDDSAASAQTDVEIVESLAARDDDVLGGGAEEEQPQFALEDQAQSAAISTPSTTSRRPALPIPKAKVVPKPASIASSNRASAPPRPNAPHIWAIPPPIDSSNTAEKKNPWLGAPESLADMVGAMALEDVDGGDDERLGNVEDVEDAGNYNRMLENAGDVEMGSSGTNLVAAADPVVPQIAPPPSSLHLPAATTGVTVIGGGPTSAGYLQPGQVIGAPPPSHELQLPVSGFPAGVFLGSPSLGPANNVVLQQNASAPGFFQGGRDLTTGFHSAREGAGGFAHIPPVPALAPPFLPGQQHQQPAVGLGSTTAANVCGRTTNEGVGVVRPAPLPLVGNPQQLPALRVGGQSYNQQGIMAGGSSSAGGISAPQLAPGNNIAGFEQFSGAPVTPVPPVGAAAGTTAPLPAAAGATTSSVPDVKMLAEVWQANNALLNNMLLKKGISSTSGPAGVEPAVQGAPAVVGEFEPATSPQQLASCLAVKSSAPAPPPQPQPQAGHNYKGGYVYPNDDYVNTGMWWCGNCNFGNRPMGRFARMCYQCGTQRDVCEVPFPPEKEYLRQPKHNMKHAPAPAAGGTTISGSSFSTRGFQAVAGPIASERFVPQQSPPSQRNQNFVPGGNLQVVNGGNLAIGEGQNPAFLTGANSIMAANPPPPPPPQPPMGTSDHGGYGLGVPPPPPTSAPATYLQHHEAVLGAPVPPPPPPEEGPAEFGSLGGGLEAFDPTAPPVLNSSEEEKVAAGVWEAQQQPHEVHLPAPVAKATGLASSSFDKETSKRPHQGTNSSILADSKDRHGGGGPSGRYKEERDHLPKEDHRHLSRNKSFEDRRGDRAVESVVARRDRDLDSSKNRDRKVEERRKALLERGEEQAAHQLSKSKAKRYHNPEAKLELKSELEEAAVGSDKRKSGSDRDRDRKREKKRGEQADDARGNRRVTEDETDILEAAEQLLETDEENQKKKKKKKKRSRRTEDGEPSEDGADNYNAPVRRVGMDNDDDHHGIKIVAARSPAHKAQLGAADQDQEQVQVVALEDNGSHNVGKKRSSKSKKRKRKRSRSSVPSAAASDADHSEERPPRKKKRHKMKGRKGERSDPSDEEEEGGFAASNGGGIHLVSREKVLAREARPKAPVLLPPRQTSSSEEFSEEGNEEFYSGGAGGGERGGEDNPARASKSKDLDLRAKIDYTDL